MKPSRPSLRSALTRRMLLLAVLPCAIVSVAAVLWLNSVVQTFAERRHAAIAARAAAVLDAHAEVSQEMLRQLCAMQSLLRPVEIADLAKLSLADDGKALQAICILDGEGFVRGAAVRPAFAARRDELIGLDLSRLLQLAADETTQAITAGTWKSPLSNTPVHVLLTKDSHGAVIGLLDPAALQTLIWSQAPVDYLTAIFSPDGQVVSADGPDCDKIGQLAIESQFMPARVERRTWAGQTYLLGIAKSAATPWTVVIGSSEPDAVVVYMRSLPFAIVAAMLLIAVSAAAAMRLARKTAKPLTVLEQEVREVGHSRDRQISGEGFAETESIASSVRSLAAELRDHDARLHRLNVTIASVATGATNTNEQPPMSGLVAELQVATRAHCVIAAEWTSGPRPRARIIAALTNVSLQDEFAYELTGHPSHRVASGELFHVSTGISQLYPESPLLRLTGADGYIALPLVLRDGTIGGHIEVIDDREILLDDNLRNLLLLFVARGSAELQRIHADRRVRDTESLYASVTLDQEEIVVRWVIDGTITFANDAFCRFVRRERPEIIGQSLYVLVPEHDRERFRDRSLELTALIPTRRSEQPFLDADGNVHWFDWSHRAITDSKGRVVEYQGTGRAITHLRQVKDDLQRARTTFAAVAENTDSAFWLTEPATQKRLYVNPGFRRLWGVDDARTADMPMAWANAIDESQRAQVVRNYLLRAADGQYSETYRIIRPDGSVHTIRDRAVPLRGADGSLTLIVHIANEVMESPAPSSPNPA